LVEQAKPYSRGKDKKMDLLEVRWINGLFHSRWFPLVPQLVMLSAFGLLVAGGIGVSTDDMAFAKVLRNTNLANLVVWSYWWPLVIVGAVLLGRVWCMVCPIELVSYLASRLGLRRKVPDWFDSGWIITVFYALVLIVGIHGLAIHRVPRRMAFYLLMLLGLAAVVGLIYEKRAFCSYICPVGYLLGLYALVSPLEWRVRDKSVCSSCKTKDCVAKKNRYRLTGRSCTSGLYPAAIQDNRQGLLCTQCLKACPNDNLRLSTRRPFADFFGRLRLRAAELGFILLVSGFIVYEVLSEWSVTKAILTWLPGRVVGAMGLGGATAGMVSAIIMFVVFPAFFFLTVIALAKIWSRVPAGEIARAFGLLLLVTMACAHLVKSMLKMTSRIPYWPYALSRPAGIETARQLVNHKLTLDNSVTNALYRPVSITAAVILLAGLVAVLLIWRKSSVMKGLDPAGKIVILIGSLAYWGIFGVTIVAWRFF